MNILFNHSNHQIQEYNQHAKGKSTLCTIGVACKIKSLLDIKVQTRAEFNTNRVLSSQFPIYFELGLVCCVLLV